MSCGFAPGAYPEHAQDLTHSASPHKFPVSLNPSHLAPKCIQPHAHTPRKISDIPELPELPIEYNFVCKQHNGFMTFMTLSATCLPVFLVMLHPQEEGFCLRNNLQEVFHKYKVYETCSVINKSSSLPQSWHILHGSHREICLIPLMELKGGRWNSIYWMQTHFQLHKTPSRTVREPMRVCVLVKERDRSKMQSNLWKNGGKKVTTYQVWKHILLSK